MPKILPAHCERRATNALMTALRRRCGATIDTLNSMPRSSPIVKRSIVVGGHKTSITLEEAFWTELKTIALTEKMTTAELVTRIDGTREQGNLSSAIRLFVLRHVRNEAKLTDVAHPYIAEPERAFSRQPSK